MKKAFFAMTLLALVLTGCAGVTPVAELSSVPQAVATHPELHVITTENVKNLEEITKWGKEGTVYDVAVSPDRETVAVRTMDGVHFYDSKTLEERNFVEDKVIETADLVLAISYSPDGKYLAMAAHATVLFLDLATGKYVKRLISPIPDAYLTNIEISPDNRYAIVTTSKGSLYCDGAGGNYALYDITDDYGRLVFDRYDCSPSYSRYRFTADNRAYFFLWYATSLIPYQMDVVDLTTGGLIQSTQYDLHNSDPNRTFYDISPDGKVFASADPRDGKYATRLVDTGTGEVLQTVEDYITFTASSDGSIHWMKMFPGWRDRISQDCKIGVEAAVDYEEVISNGDLVTVIFPRSSSPQSLELWDKNKCQLVKQIPLAPKSLSIYSAKGKFSPEGRLYANVNGSNLEVWDVKTGQIRFVAKSPSFRFPINVFVFSQNGTRLITSTYERNSISHSPYQPYSLTVWDTGTGKMLKTIDTGEEFLYDLTAGPDSDLIAALDVDSIGIWNIATGQKLAFLPPGYFAFDKTGNSIWVVSKESPSVSSYDVNTGRPLRTILVSEPNARGFFLNQDASRGALIAYNKKDNLDSLMILDMQLGKEIYRISRGLWPVNLASNGEYFVTYSNDGFMDVWNFQSNAPLRKIYGYYTINTTRNLTEYSYIPSDYIGGITFSPDNKMIVSLDLRNNMRIWDVSSGVLLGEISPRFKIIDCSFSPDGRLLVAAGTDGFIHVWGVKNPD